MATQLPRDEYDLNELFREAQIRWLKPAEVFSILQNHENYTVTYEPPDKPTSGSVFLYNRRVTRFFRKDGHTWKKKRDGRNIGEAHERLKVGYVDALNCYYAHGEVNPNFQRRSYWMLDAAHEHIVLVHYRDISEAGSSGSASAPSSDLSSTLNSDVTVYSEDTNDVGAMTGFTDVYNHPWSSVSPGPADEVSSGTLQRNGHNIDSTHPGFQQSLRKLTEQLSLGDEVDGYEDQPQNLRVPEYSVETFEQGTVLGSSKELKRSDQIIRSPADLSINSLLLPPPGQLHGQMWDPKYQSDGKSSPSWKDIAEMCTDPTKSEPKVLNRMDAQRSIGLAGAPTNTLGPEASMNHPNNDQSVTEIAEIAWDWPVMEAKGTESGSGFHNFSVTNLGQDFPPESWRLPGTEAPTLPSKAPLQCTNKGKGSMDNPIKVESDNPIGESSHSLNWDETKDLTLDGSKSFQEYYESSLFDHGNSLGTLPKADPVLTISRVQWFSIREISPEWAYSSTGSKVVIVGDVLLNDQSERSWYCMFGSIEVPAEVIQQGVLRCYAPPQEIGIVSLCVTCGNRESCSEIREFEYRPWPSSYPANVSLPKLDRSNSREVMYLLVRFVQMLLGRSRSSLNSEDVLGSSSDRPNTANDHLEAIMDSVLAGMGTSDDTMDSLLQELLKLRLNQWISEKRNKDDSFSCPLSKQEQTIIHITAALGYEWALASLLDCGVGINFRDRHGWTALHWAARFGRIKMVAALLAAGASVGAVTDPTPQDRTGRTAAAIAAQNGHKGIAAYLSEAALTTHLTSLTLNENEISKGSAAVEAERSVETISERRRVKVYQASEDLLTLKDSLAAVRTAAQAAARIQSAFRAHSFRKRKQKAAGDRDEYGLTPSDIHELSAATSKPHRLANVHERDNAANRIQTKYRGWKGRRNFVNLRRNVVKIQAHVRGHQTRRKFREFLWSVGILDKAILRWRRKGTGLRGIRSGMDVSDDDKDEDILKSFRKLKVDLAIKEDVSRVESLVESPQARQQYSRMLESYQQARAEFGGRVAGEASSSSRDDSMEEDDLHHL